ncbi:efflux RND transporter periplasmic adaptor subunit [Halochromatium sp.]
MQSRAIRLPPSGLTLFLSGLFTVTFTVADATADATGSPGSGGDSPNGKQPEYVVEAKQVPVTRIVHAEVQPVERPEARARIAGLLRELVVDEGDAVEDGQVIARVEPPKLESRIAAARAERTRAEASERQTQRALARAEELHVEDVMSQADLDDAREAAVSATNAVEAAAAEIDTLLARQERGEVLAPATGWVIEVLPTTGSAMQAGGLIARIAAAPALIRVAVPERHLGRLQQATSLTLETTLGPQQAELVKLYPDVRQGRVEADLRLPEGQPALPVGRRVPVRLTLDQVERLVVPERLISERHGLTFVYRAEAGCTLVQLGARRGDRMIVLSGLRAGDRLIAP